MKPSAIPYRDFAAIYDRLMGKRFLRLWWQWFRPLARKAGWRFGSLADIAGGTGDAAACFRSQGIPMVVVDRSAAMLRRCREKLPEARCLQQDMRVLRLPRPVDLALCVFGGVHYLRSEAELRQFFRRVLQNLTRDGLFCFDFSSLAFLKAHYGGGVDRFDQEDYSSVWRHRWLAQARCSEIYVESLEKKAGRWIRHRPELHRQQGFTLAQVRRALRQAGFRGMLVSRLNPGPSPAQYGVVAGRAARPALTSQK